MRAVVGLSSGEVYRALYGDNDSAVNDADAFFGEWQAFHGSTPVPDGWAQMVHTPGIARLLLALDRHVDTGTGWADLPALRELAVLAVHRRLDCEYGFASHLASAQRAGLSVVQIASIAFPTSGAFDADQQLVLAFANAVLDCNVPDDLFARLVDSYTNRGALELTVLIGHAAWWAIIHNVLGPEIPALPVLPEVVNSAEPARGSINSWAVSSRSADSRIPGIYSPGQFVQLYPNSTTRDRAEVDALFERHPWLDWHPNFSMFAHSPTTTDLMMQYTYALLELPWVKRKARWPAILVCDKLLLGEDSYMSHLNSAHTRGGVSELQLMLTDFPASAAFDAEERLAMTFTKAAISDRLDDQLVRKAKAMFGDRGLVEFALALAYWTFFCYFECALAIDPATRAHTAHLWREGWVIDSLGYGEQIKAQALALASDSGRDAAAIAEELGIPLRALEAWLAAAR